MVRFGRAVDRLFGHGSLPWRYAQRRQQKRGWKPGRYGYSPSLDMASGDVGKAFMDAYNKARREMKEGE